jgi:hypothetical protein
LKLKGLKVKQILVFCKNQSVLRESYYGIKHNSSDTEHLNNGIENCSNGIEDHRTGVTPNSSNKRNNSSQDNSGGALYSLQFALLQQRYCRTFEANNIVLYEPRTTVPHRVC